MNGNWPIHLRGKLWDWICQTQLYRGDNAHRLCFLNTKNNVRWLWTMAKFWVSSHKRWSKRTYWLLDWDRVFFRNNIACKDAEKRFRRQNSMSRWNSWADKSPGVTKQGHGSWRVGENGLNAMTPELPTLIVSFFVGTIPRYKLKSKYPVKLRDIATPLR